MKTLKNLNRLEKEAYKYIRSYEDIGYSSPESLVNDLLNNGCVSGMVSHLIYYADTLKFFKKFKGEINELLQETINNTGLSISELFGNKFDTGDPLCLDTQNQNLLAWFGFEESVRIVAEKLDIEV
jgi:hypothetical protein